MAPEALRNASKALEEFGLFVQNLIDAVRRSGEGTEYRRV
jgi:hypothetical protein